MRPTRCDAPDALQCGPHRRSALRLYPAHCRRVMDPPSSGLCSSQVKAGSRAARHRARMDARWWSSALSLLLHHIANALSHTSHTLKIRPARTRTREDDGQCPPPTPRLSPLHPPSTHCAAWPSRQFLHRGAPTQTLHSDVASVAQTSAALSSRLRCTLYTPSREELNRPCHPPPSCAVSASPRILAQRAGLFGHDR